VFSLIQNGAVLAGAEKVEDLAFNQLSSGYRWVIAADFPLTRGYQNIVRVSWPDAEQYKAILWRAGIGEALYNEPIIHSTIIPTVRRVLSRAAECGEFSNHRLASEWLLTIEPTEG